MTCEISKNTNPVYCLAKGIEIPQDVCYNSNQERSPSEVRAQLYFNDGTNDKASLAGLLFYFMEKQLISCVLSLKNCCNSPIVRNMKECFRRGDAGILAGF